MMWFVFTENYGCIFHCDDDTEGKEKVIKFLTEDMERDYNVNPEEDVEGYWVIRGEEKTFVPPSSKGDLR